MDGSRSRAHIQDVFKLIAIHGVKLAVVAVAFRQFFLVDLRREWPRLVASLLIYLAASWVLLCVYAYFVLMMVRMQLD